MRPLRCRIITGAASRQQRNAPRRWTAIMRSQSSSEVSVSACGFWMPALFTSTSMRPNRSMTAPTSAWTSASRVTSQRTDRARRLRFSSSATSDAASASRAIQAIATSAPSSA